MYQIKYCLACHNSNVTIQPARLARFVAWRALDTPVDTDIAVNGLKCPACSFVGSVEDLGDMQVFFGLENLDATGLQHKEGKVYPKSFKSVKKVSMEKATELLRQGYLAIHVK